MARVKRAVNSRKNHKKVLKLAKGYYGGKSRLFKTANESVIRALRNAYVGRRLKKRDFRRLWIARINAASRMNGLSYSKFMNGIKLAGVDINRKMLSEIAINDPKAFADLVVIAKDALAGKTVKTEVKSEVKETKKEVKAEVKEDLSKLTVAELKEMAKAKNIAGASTMKKAELLEALK